MRDSKEQRDVFPMDGFADEQRFLEAWESVKIEREVRYSLFTFGESDLPYYLILSGATADRAVSVTRGDVKITRPLIIRPENSPPEFENLFEEADDEHLAQFIMARTAKFSNWKFQNRSGSKRLVSDSVEETVAELNRKLDTEDEDRVAILTAPAPLAGFAVLKYASERILQSVPENIQELREKGFLP